MEDSIYIARMIQEIYSGNVGENQIPVVVKIDSKTLLDSLNSSKQIDEKNNSSFDCMDETTSRKQIYF
jgi:glutaredoxin 2